MTLASTLQTARSGMTAAITSVEAASHNLANSRTNGYKSVRPAFTEQEPSGSSLQIGTGVQVTGIAVDKSPGSVVVQPDGSTVELSDTDIGSEMIELIMAEDHFRASANVLDTAADMLDLLLNLRRTS